MKTLRFLLLTVFITTLVACSKDDDNTPPSSSIVGSWTLESGGIEPTTITMEGLDFPIQVSGSFINISDTNRITFKEDNTFTSVTGNIILRMEMVVFGMPQTQDVEINDFLGEGTWEIANDKLIINNDNGTTIPYQIVSFTETDLVLKANTSDIDSGTGAGVPGGLDIEVIMNLKRV